jgi:capsular exopolysaccharide synthesis family protein
MSAEPTKQEMPDTQAPDDAPGEKLGTKTGIVERAMRRLSERRDVIVWEGEPVEPSPALAYAHDSSTHRSEKLRSLRTELLMRLGSHKGAAIFAVLGARPGEGRSQLCAELALAFAQLSGKTLLVDANLRQPTLNKLFRGCRSDAGLTEVLLGKTQTMPLHRVIGPQHLALLTAGAPPANPVDLLSGVQFERLVRDWSRTYDYVLIDTPPTSLRSDGIMIANAVGNVLLVAHRHKTSFAEVTELKRRLGSTDARIVGAVLNDF